MKRLALVTIGQAPRDDIRDELVAELGAPADVVQTGALDGLDEAGIRQLAPRAGEPVLVTRLLSGAQATIGEAQVVPSLERAIRRGESRGADLTLVLCTGSFPPLAHEKPLLIAGELFAHAVSALGASVRFALLCPDRDQIETAPLKWRDAGVRITLVRSVSPYTSGGDTWAAASESLVGVDAVIMDCMGYTAAMADVVRQHSGLAPILARRAAARLTGLLL